LLRALHAVVTAAEWPLESGPEMRVRFDILAGPAEALGTTSRELIALQPFTPPPPELYETGVAVGFAPGLARERPLAKTADFAARRPATGWERPPMADGRPTQEEPEATARGSGEGASFLEPGTWPLEPSSAVGGRPSAVVAPYEYLLLDSAGRILEGTGTNFWAVRDGVVYTAGEGVLEGITREILLQLIGELGISLRLEAVDSGDIASLDEAALSGSSRALLPVVTIDGQTVGDGRPGPIMRRLLAAYNAFVAESVRTAI
jgi:branched-chain amino acid aminotransferase